MGLVVSRYPVVYIILQSHSVNVFNVSLPKIVLYGIVDNKWRAQLNKSHIH